MSLLGLINPAETLVGQPTYVAPKSDFFGLIAGEFESSRLNFNVNSSAVAKRMVLEERDAEFEKKHGASINTLWVGDKRAARNTTYRQQLIDEKLSKLTEEDESYSSIKTSAGIEAEAEKRARESFQQQNIDFQFTPGYSKYLASFIGGAGAIFTDPAQIATMFMGGAGSAYNTGFHFLKTAAIESAASAVTEAVIQPEVARWQKEVGNEYGIPQAMANVLFAGVAGGLFTVPVSAYNKAKHMKFSRQLEDMASNPGIADAATIGAEQMAKFARHLEDSPSPDYNRHNANTDAAGRFIADNDFSNLELDSRVIDDFPGLPQEAFDFLNQDRKFPVGVTEKVKVSGGVAKSTFKIKELPVSRMTTKQLEETIKSELLPKIAHQLKMDNVNEARRVGSANKKKINRTLKEIDSELDRINNLMKSEKKKIRNEVADQVKRDPKRKKELNRSVKPRIDSVNKKYMPRIIQQQNLERAMNDKLSALAIQAERKEVIRQIEKGETIDSSTYTGQRINSTIDKVVAAAKDAKKLAKLDRDKVAKQLTERGVIKQEPKPAEDVIKELEELESEIDEAFQITKSQFDEFDPETTMLIDDNGNTVSIKKWMTKYEPEENELQAIRSCATGAGE